MAGGELLGAGEAYFGGPERPGRLRDLLAERVDGVPPGGEIDWVTYYFRDRPLADALIRARQRGVRVRLTLEGRPRTQRANQTLIRHLAGGAGLGEGLRVVGGGPTDGFWRPRLHEKIYYFSHPRPVAFVGSFNPSGDEPEEEPDVIAEIGDQDRGLNNLVELCHPDLVSQILLHARRLHAGNLGGLDRVRSARSRPLRAGGCLVYFWPRLAPHPLDRLLAELGTGDRVRLACSHLKGRGSRRAVLRPARQGARVEILAEWTDRRVPPGIERRISQAGVAIRRVGLRRRLPMHCKFALIETRTTRTVAFGSLNWTWRSRNLNREVLVLSQHDAKLFDAFAAQWEALAAGQRG